MCGRFTQRKPASDVAKAFELVDMPDLFPRYNIAPTQDVPIVRLGDDEKRHLSMVRWGLIPFWAKDAKIGSSMINARADSVAEKPAFKKSFRTRRCLVIADGFYEWQKNGTKKQPYYIKLKSDQPFAFAGLWDRWKHGEAPIESCTVITTEPSDSGQRRSFVRHAATSRNSAAHGAVFVRGDMAAMGDGLPDGRTRAAVPHRPG